MKAARLIFVSDTHLSANAPEALDNWAATVRHITAAAPDLVIHLGDLSMDGARNPADLVHARHNLDLLPARWHAVPGNHDIGDNPLPNTSPSMLVSEARRQHWISVVGPDYWSLEVAGWLLVAVNAQLTGSGLPAETSQWSWLENELGKVGPHQPVALLTHKPVAASASELEAAPPYRFWPPAAREHLQDLIAGRPLALVVSGHVHQSRQLSIDGTSHVWAPTTWAVLPDHAQPVLGAKRCGLLSLTLGPGLAPDPEFPEPDGMKQLTLTADIPDPYHT